MLETAAEIVAILRRCAKNPPIASRGTRSCSQLFQLVLTNAAAAPLTATSARRTVTAPACGTDNAKGISATGTQAA